MRGEKLLPLALVLACGPGGAGTGDAKGEAKTVETTVETKTVETKTVTTVETKPDAPKTEPATTEAPKGDGLVAEVVRPGSAQLEGRTIEASSDGGWEVRRAGAASGGFDSEADYGRLAGDGLGMTGTGLGGGGSGEGGLGIGTIGKGGGSGTGRGYGSGGAARAESAPADGRRMEPASAPKPGGPVQPKPDVAAKTGPLKAGSTDDNADYKGFLKFLDTWTTRSDVAGQFQPLDVRDRAYVRVLDGDGLPFPGAQITIREVGGQRDLWRARTYGDGRAPYYPKLWGAQVQSSGRYSVSAVAGGETLSAEWDGKSELVLKTAAPRKPQPLTLEVLFLIDTTGSMGDEIAQVKSTLLAVTGKVKKVREDLDLRYGAVLYRDINDDYVTMAYPFTADVQAFDTAMRAVQAGGGGDLPESMNQGLDRAVSGMPWQPDAAKLVFLIADAAPQMRFKGDVLYGDSAVQAVGRGIRIHSVAASGLDELGTLVLRQLAQLTRGKFIFIEYGSTQATAAKHGVSGPVEGGNNLDDIIAREITAEIEGWGTADRR